jgi:hypothetical protein
MTKEESSFEMSSESLIQASSSAFRAELVNIKAYNNNIGTAVRSGILFLLRG